jgi:cobaltochelatase CobS
MPYVKALANAKLPIALVGPPGTGKTTLAGQLADELGFGPDGFGMVSMTRGTSPSAFNGRPKIGSDGTDALVKALIANGQTQEALQIARDASANADVITSQFERIFEHGGVFLFDEMDAAEPNLLLTVNAALANGKFANPSTGKIVHRHPDFVPVAGMNTLGLGGDRKMVGRERQDAAALDRWHAGRVQIELDPKLEASIFWAIVSA